MLERISGLPGTPLDFDAYAVDFERHFWRVAASWKLERCQDFREPDVASWAAMARGDWARAVELAEAMRPGIEGLQRRLDARGITQHRVRVAARPVTPYVQWEMQVLKIRAELGERITVLTPEDLGALEETGELPEVLVLGERVAYEIVYDDRRVLAGSRRLEDPEVIAACAKEIRELWAAGEDLLAYFDREIAPLPPPGPAGRR